MQARNPSDDNSSGQFSPYLRLLDEGQGGFGHMVAIKIINRTSLEHYSSSIATLGSVKTYLEKLGLRLPAKELEKLEDEIRFERGVAERLMRPELCDSWPAIYSLLTDLNNYPLIPSSYRLHFIKRLSQTSLPAPSFQILADTQGLIRVIDRADRATAISLLLYALCKGNNLNTVLEPHQMDVLISLDTALIGVDIQLAPEMKSALIRQIESHEFPHFFSNVQALIDRVVLERINLLLQSEKDVNVIIKLVQLASLEINIPENLAERILQLAADQPFASLTIRPVPTIMRLFNKVSDPNKKVNLLVRSVIEGNLLYMLTGTMPISLLIELSAMQNIRLDIPTKMAFLNSQNGAELIRSGTIFQRLMGVTNVEHELFRARLFKIKALIARNAAFVGGELIEAVKQANLNPDLPSDLSSTLLSMLAYNDSISIGGVDLTNHIKKIENKSFKTFILLKSITPGNSLFNIMRPVYSNHFFSTWAPSKMLKELIGTPLVMDKDTHAALREVLGNQAVTKKLDNEVYDWLLTSYTKYSPDFQSHIMSNDNL